MWRFYFTSSGFWGLRIQGCFLMPCPHDALRHRKPPWPIFPMFHWYILTIRSCIDSKRRSELVPKWAWFGKRTPSPLCRTVLLVFVFTYISEILTDQPRSTLLLSPWLLKDTYCTVNHDDVRKTTLEESNRVLQCLFFMAAHFVSMMIFSNTANKSKRLRSAELFRYLLDIRTTQPTSSVRLTVNRGLRAKKHWAFYFPVPNSRASGYSCAGYHQNALPGRVGWLSTAETAQYTCRGRLGS